jgi:hypothetical protein
MFLGGCNKDAASASPDDAAGAKTAAKIKCFGANECAGQAACDVPDGRVEPGSVGHACAGQNECKGKGWISLPADECTAQGGEPL